MFFDYRECFLCVHWGKGVQSSERVGRRSGKPLALLEALKLTADYHHSPPYIFTVSFPVFYIYNQFFTFLGLNGLLLLDRT